MIIAKGIMIAAMGFALFSAFGSWYAFFAII